MGFLWKGTKSVMTKALDTIEGKAPPGKYALHPDHAYLGRNYYAKDSRLPPGSAGTLESVGAPGLIPQIFAQGSAAGGQEREQEQQRSIAGMQPHVHIGLEAMATPLHLPKDKWAVLRQHDLIDDDTIDVAVGRERELYWVVKAAVVLMVKERAAAYARTLYLPPEDIDEPGWGCDVRELVGRGMEEQKVPLREEELNKVIRATAEELGFEKQKVREGMYGTGMAKNEKRKEVGESRKESKARNLLSSPSVEDFFAESRSEVIDTLPANPLAMPRTSKPPAGPPKPTSAVATVPSSKQIYTNPLELIPWSEMVVLFRRDTKELFVRKQDGLLYPVIWKVRAMQRKVIDEEENAEGVKFTDVETEIDDEAWTVVDGM